MPLKNSPLQEYHREYGVKTAPFGGWTLPFHFEPGVAAETEHTVNQVSVFDLCGGAKFRLAGDPAKIGAWFCPTPAELSLGESARFYCLNAHGFAVDSVQILRMAEADFLLLGLPGTTLPEMPGVEVQELTEALARLIVAGPRAAEVLTAAGATQLPEAGHWLKGTVDELPCILFADDLLGVPAWSLLFGADSADELWDLLLDTEPVLPAGMGALETLRIAAGIPQRGRELTGTQLPPAPIWPVVELEERHAPLSGTLLEGFGKVTSAAYCGSCGKTFVLCLPE